MNRAHAQSVVLDMAFESRVLYDRFVREVRQDPSLASNILRGRVSRDGAWMRLELRGASHRIGDLIERWKDAGVTHAGEPVLVA